MRELFRAKKGNEHPHSWVWESLEGDPAFSLRAVFGTKGLYYAGRMVLCCSAREEPWRGILVCTEREHHDELKRMFPGLTAHPILSKWLYISEAEETFEDTAMRLIVLIKRRDPKIGVLPKPRRRKKTLRFSPTMHP